MDINGIILKIDNTIMPNILLSICIPTYNRCVYLEKTLYSIVSQEKFVATNEVEIIISDNCSSDNTQEVANRFIANYGKKIRYYRNRENIKDANFECALSYGKGLFLKLNNDTLTHKEDSLGTLIELIKQNAVQKKILFFLSSESNSISTQNLFGLDTFIETVSFYSTSIACFGIWKSDFDYINDFSRSEDLQLVQVDILLRLVVEKQNVIIIDAPIFKSQILKERGGYNIFEVFISNYIGLLSQHLDNNQISKLTFQNEKVKLLFDFIFKWYCRIFIDKEDGLYFKKNDFILHLIKNYSIIDIVQFYYRITKYRVLNFQNSYMIKIKRYFRNILVKKLSNLMQDANNVIDKKNWDQISNGFKSIGQNCNILAPYFIANQQCISIGENFYASHYLKLHAVVEYQYQVFSPRIVIGNNVSIESNCHIGAINSIYIGNNVLIASNVYISDHSHGQIVKKELVVPPISRNLSSKGEIKICDNVWIGDSVCILPGVTIGENSIIGANAVVTKDVPPNSVAVGVPAKIIKHI